MYSRANRPGALSTSRRVVFFIGIFTLLLSVLTPVLTISASDAVAKAAAGQEPPQECEPGLVYDEDAGECVEENDQPPECEPGFVYDESYGGCVPEENGEQPTGIQIEKWDCTTEDAYDWEYEQLLNDCDQSQNQYTLVHGGDNLQEQSQTGPGFYEWGEQPAGGHYVYEELPDGYGQPRVFCDIYVPQQGNPSPSEENVQNGNTVGWQLEPGEWVYCYWFNVYEGGFGQIHITKYDCAAYEGAVDSQTWDYWQQECAPWTGDPVEYQLYQGQNQVGTENTGDGGEAHFDEAPTGEVTVAEVLPEGYTSALVFCSYHPADQQNSSGYEPVTVEQGFFHEWDLEEGYILDCLWFNFQDVAATTEGGSVVDFYKYTCSYDTLAEQDYAYYFDECQPYDEGWEFNLEWDGGGSPGTTDSEGLFSWSGVPVGSWTGSETVPQGWGEPTIWCRYVEWPDEATYDNNWFPVDPSLNATAELTWQFEYDGVHIECYWFNYEPAGGGNWIDFYKYVCTYDTPQDQNQDYYLENCEFYAGWDFEVTWEGGGGTETTDSDGKASWEGIPQGSWSGGETLEEGWSVLPVLWCRYVDWPDEATGINDDWFAYDLAGGSQITTGFDYEGLRLECYWFNFEPEPNYNWVDFYKYTCPYELPTDGDIDYYLEQCETYENWQFNLEWDGGSDSGTTDAEGHTFWSGIPQGGWTGSETLPDGAGQPLIWCRYVEWPDEATYDNNWFPVEPTLNGVAAIEWQFEYDQMRIECYWFNFVPEGDNWIQFYKLWCDETATYDYTFDQLREACEFRPDPVDLTLNYGGTEVTQSTSNDTPAEWQDVPSGEWNVTEPSLAGYGTPIIWCQYVEWPESAEGLSQEPFQLTVANGIASHQLDYQGVRIACIIFNIPFEQNWIDITKWWCAETVTTPYEQSPDNLLEECERYTEGAEFNLEWEGGSEAKPTDGEGNAEWDGIPQSPWSMHESIPDGYGDPVVWCRYVEWPDGAEVNSDPFSIPAPGGSFANGFTGGGYRIHCDIFNIPYNDPGWITIYKWYCVYGVPTDASAEYLRDNCEPVTTGVDFSLRYGDASVPMTTDSEGKAEWNTVPPGEWTLEETSAASYGAPLIWCQWVDWPTEADSEFTDELFQPQSEGATMTGSHAYPGMRLVCYWFNFGYEGGDNGIIIYKYWCPPNSDYGESVGSWVEGCNETMEGTSFTLRNDDGTFPKATSGGQAEWTGLPDGAFSVQESLPTGYEEPRLWCYRYVYEENEEVGRLSTENFEPFSTEGGLWEDSFEGEGGPWRIICYWFNIPGDDNTITVYKYNCEYVPAGFNTLGQWLDACPTWGNSVGFTLDHDGGSEHKETADGKAEWTGMPEGPFTLTEDPLPGYGEPILWCAWTAYYEGAVYDAFPAQKQVSGGVYHGEISYPGTTYVCYWFNIPADDSRIVVYKYNCPEQEGVLETSLENYKELCKEQGDGIDFTLENSAGSSSKAIAGGSATWYDVPQGEFTLTESIPFGYGEPLWWCGFAGYENGAVYDGFPQQVNAPGGVFTGSIDYDVTYYYCWVFNFPDYEREVTVYKWWCPEGYQATSENYEDWQGDCTTEMSGIGFQLTHDGGASWKNTNGSGKASWYGTVPGGHTLREQFLPGYEAPYVFCSLEATYEDGAAYAENYEPYPVSDNAWEKDLGEYAGYKWICHVFNIPKGPGEITIYKWWCPPGYDVTVWGADPMKDCTEEADGIPFTLDKPVGPSEQQETGDTGSGQVYWNDLSPGTYTIAETPPGNLDYTFIWECYGNAIPKVHPNPLTWGNVLKVDLAGGDAIVCHWYNVPVPENGWVTLYKYQCWTATYKSEVDCELYEFGASFELFTEPGGASMGVGDTNAGGTYTWGDLDEGAYTLEEISHQPCKITSTKIDDSNNVWVDAGEGTVVKVYNCKSDTSTTPVPGGKVPTKYPNTGVGIAAEAPAVQQQGEPEGEGTPADDQEAAAEFYQINCLDAPAGGDGTPAAAAEEGGGDLPPFLQDAAEETPVPDEDATAEATTGEAEDCVRGSVPVNIVIDAANVDYDIEVLEIVDGVMQAPTGPNLVSWYKETARLGEPSNIVIAGHVNWWGVPEGPFFHLQDLQEGDRIELTGEDGVTYVFEVQWVRQESNLAPPDPEVVGPTGESTLTLITCGGEWDASISEYNERTVARAIQVDTIPAEEPPVQGSAPIPLTAVMQVWRHDVYALAA